MDIANIKVFMGTSPCSAIRANVYSTAVAVNPVFVIGPRDLTNTATTEREPHNAVNGGTR